VTRTARGAESPITRIFGGTFRSTLRVPHAKDSVLLEAWRALALDITPDGVRSIGAALAQLAHPQTVQVAAPTRAGATVDAQQTVLVDALPPILVLHLKRFMYDTAVRDVVKLGKAVAFERELEIAPGACVSPARVCPADGAQSCSRPARASSGGPRATSCSRCCTTTARPRRAGTTRSTCCTRTAT
jgi:ubiquitin carboxyl-terminal hydrolase 10